MVRVIRGWGMTATHSATSVAWTFAVSCAQRVVVTVVGDAGVSTGLLVYLATHVCARSTVPGIVVTRTMGSTHTHPGAHRLAVSSGLHTGPTAGNADVAFCRTCDQTHHNWAHCNTGVMCRTLLISVSPRGASNALTAGVHMAANVAAWDSICGVSLWYTRVHFL